MFLIPFQISQIMRFRTTDICEANLQVSQRVFSLLSRKARVIVFFMLHLLSEVNFEAMFLLSTSAFKDANLNFYRGPYAAPFQLRTRIKRSMQKPRYFSK